jgi:hypothetical protein
MLLELARFLSLMLCILSQYAVFHTAFLVPGRTLHDRIWDSLTLLALAAAIAVVGGLIFREPMHGHPTGDESIVSTLPMLLFFWATAALVVFFVASWYLETYCIFYRDVRRF